ncbi:VCBS repeat-containing protein [Streptomyces sp. CAU 1734]|uniref:VCBS repeat-containing protein n=1 Tax=Streptomyces sp. CAU 1734 TaxID=3140360 RepID=UPI003260C2D7
MLRMGAWRPGVAGLAMAALLSASLGAASARQAVAATTCAGGVDSDFNGDGLRDVAIADPEAPVGGKERAGLIRVVLGGDKGVVEVSQDTPNVSDGAETGDQFGFSFSAYDANLDGCSDLAVGIPFEDVGSVADAGLVHVIYGSPSGIGQGTPDRGLRQGTGGLLFEHSEAEDWVGYSVATTKSASGHPYLIIGVPGEDDDTKKDIGLVTAVWGVNLTAASATQDSAGVWETAEAYDRMGTTVAASGQMFVVGVPGESLDTDTNTGAVMAFRPSINANGIPDPVWGMGQDRDPGSEISAETGDRFGSAIAIAPYRPAGAASATDYLLAVGAPGEDIATTVDAGAVVTYHVTAAGGVSILNWIDQNTADVEQESQAGDFFGQRLFAVNTSPTAVTTAATARLAIGVPGEESSDEHRDKGGVHIMPLLGPPGASDSWIDPGYGIPATPAPGQLTGMSLSGTRTILYVGMPYGPAADHGVHGFPWNVANGGAPTQTFKPGQGGIPAGTTTFGAVVR